MIASGYRALASRGFTNAYRSNGNINMSKKSIENPEELSAKSEEVQSIIERMPTYWAKWVVLCVCVLMGIIILLGFVIQYPDVVAGQISITATEAPVRLVANSHGRHHPVTAQRHAVATKRYDCLYRKRCQL